MIVTESRLLSASAAVLALAFTASAASAQPRVERSIPVAPGVYELVFNPQNDDVYVAAAGSRSQNQATVVQIDGATLQVVNRIDVTAAPLFGLGLNARTQTIYGTSTRLGRVSAVRLSDGRVTTFGEGRNAHVREAVVDEASDTVYVSVVGGGSPGRRAAAPAQGAAASGTAAPAPAGDGDESGSASAVWVIDGAANTVRRVITLPDVAGLTGIQIDPRNNRLFGTAMSSNEIVVVDLTSGEVARRFASGGQRPVNLVYDAQGDRLFVANQGDGVLTVLNTGTGAVLATVATGAGALSVAHNPAVSQVYVANRGAGTVTVVDSRSYAVLANLQTGAAPQSIAIDRETNRVFVTNKTRGRRPAPGADAPAPQADDPNGDTLTVIVP